MPADGGDLFCTGFRLRKAARRLTQVYDHALAAHGLTVTQFGLLAMLARDGAMPLGHLAEKAGMDRTSMTRTIRPLERDGLVRLTCLKADRRIREVDLTGAGRSTFEAAVAPWQKVQQQVGRTLGASDVDALHALLATVAAFGPPPVERRA